MTKKYSVPESIKLKAHLNEASFDSMYLDSINNPESFWATQASKHITWIKEPKK